MMLTARGIPFVYYGFEQMMTGKTDQDNRKPIWNLLDKKSPMYLFIKVVNKVRKAESIAA